MALTTKKVYAILKRQISDMEAKIKTPIIYRGTVATADLLPLNPDIGDMYNIESKSIYGEAGMNVAWNGVVWDTMGAPIDMSLYIKSSELADWVKQQNKPTYTADEVGALPDTTVIPSKTSELQNDSGFLTKIPDNYLSGTDKTLSVSGKAADAKATGDKITELSADISNKLNKNQGSENSGKIAGINESGDIVPMFPVSVDYNEETNCLEFGSDQKMELNKGINLDSTLTKTGYAADAGAVGEITNSLKEDITEYLVEYKEIPYVFQAGAISQTGYDSTNIASASTYARSTTIQMRTGDRIAISDSISCTVFKYDLKDRTFLSKEIHDNGADIIFEQNTLIRLSIRQNDGGTISNSAALGEIISGNYISYIRENCKVLRKTPKNNLIAEKYFGELYAGGFDTNGIFAYYKKVLNTSTVVLYANTILTCSTEYKISYLSLDKSPMAYDNIFANKLTIPSDGNYIVFVQKADSSIFDDDAIYDADIRISFPRNDFDPSQYIPNTDFQNLKSGYGTPYTAKEDSVILETIRNRNENTVTLAVIADTHYSGSYDTRNQAYAINRIAERCGALAVIHLGDAINGINQLSANGYFLSLYWEEQLRTHIPILYTVAHHEQYGVDKTSKYHNDPTALSQGQCIGYYGNQYKYLTHVLSDDKSNWYVDYENLRIIGLNSCDPNPVSFSLATAQFLKNSLDSANGKKIIVVSHAPANKKALGVTVEIEGGSAIENALNSYSGKIIAYIHGHTHWDNIGTVDGNKFPYISICCAVPDKVTITDERKANTIGEPISYDRKIGDFSEYCFDIVNIHLDTNVINIKRFGVGNDRNN